MDIDGLVLDADGVDCAVQDQPVDDALPEHADAELPTGDLQSLQVLVRRKGFCDVCPAPCYDKKTPFCIVHKRTYDSLMRQAQRQDIRIRELCKKGAFKGSGSTKPPSQVAYIKQVRRKAVFRNLMHQFQEQCPGEGTGCYRPYFDFLSFQKTYSASTGIRCEWTGKYMTWAQFRAWALSPDGGEIDEAEAEGEWGAMMRNSKWPRDHKGRDGAMRLLIHTGDTVVGHEGFEETNQTILSQKPQSYTGEACDEMITGLVQNFDGLNNANAEKLCNGHIATAFQASGKSSSGMAVLGGPLAKGPTEDQPFLSDLVPGSSLKRKGSDLDNASTSASSHLGSSSVQVASPVPEGKKRKSFSPALHQVSLQTFWATEVKGLQSKLTSRIMQISSLMADVKRITDETESLRVATGQGDAASQETTILQEFQAKVDCNQTLLELLTTQGDKSVVEQQWSSHLKAHPFPGGVQPCVDFSAVKPIESIKAMGIAAINAITDLESAEAAKNQLGQLTAPLMQFLTAALGTARELKTASNTFKTSYITAKRKQDQQAKAAAKATAKGGPTGHRLGSAKARAVASAGQANAEACTKPAVFTFNFADEAHHACVTEYTVDSYQAAVAEASIDLSLPFVVRNVPWVLPGKNHELQKKVTYFENSFNAHKVIQSQGRGQCFVTDDSLQSQLVNMVPSSPQAGGAKLVAVSTAGLKAEDVTKLTGLSIFGLKSNRHFACLEYGEIGAVRAIFKGQRFVAYCDFDRIASLMAEREVPKLQNHYSFNDAKCFLAACSTEDLSDLLKARPRIILATTLNSQDVMYMPQGAIVHEVAINGVDVFGFRVPVLVNALGTQASLQRLFDSYTELGKEVTCLQQAVSAIKDGANKSAEPAPATPTAALATEQSDA